MNLHNSGSINAQTAAMPNVDATNSTPNAVSDNEFATLVTTTPEGNVGEQLDTLEVTEVTSSMLPENIIAQFFLQQMIMSTNQPELINQGNVEIRAPETEVEGFTVANNVNPVGATLVADSTHTIVRERTPIRTELSTDQTDQVATPVVDNITEAVSQPTVLQQPEAKSSSENTDAQPPDWLEEYERETKSGQIELPNKIKNDTELPTDSDPTHDKIPVLSIPNKPEPTIKDKLNPKVQERILQETGNTNAVNKSNKTDKPGEPDQKNITEVIVNIKEEHGQHKNTMMKEDDGAHKKKEEDSDHTSDSIPDKAGKTSDLTVVKNSDIPNMTTNVDRAQLKLPDNIKITVATKEDVVQQERPPLDITSLVKQDIAQKYVEQINAAITTAVRDGVRSTKVQLHPEHLGKIEISLEKSQDSPLTQVKITLERAETMEVFRSDVSKLEKTLASSGLKTEPGSLHFTMYSDQNPHSHHHGREHYTGNYDLPFARLDQESGIEQVAGTMFLATNKIINIWA